MRSKVPENFPMQRMNNADAVARNNGTASFTPPPFQLKGAEEEDPLLKAQMKKKDEEVQMKAKEDEVQMKKPEEEPKQLTTINDNEEEREKEEETGKIPGAQMKKGEEKKNASGSGSSTKLPEEVQAKMENTMGQDFSNVNMVKDSAQAENVGALAYAQGNDVHFAPGQFQPNTTSGQELIGHELAHVGQQREGRVQPTTQAKGMAVNDDPKLEKEADDVGKMVAQAKMPEEEGKKKGAFLRK